jgi:hypothetical protein
VSHASHFRPRLTFPFEGKLRKLFPKNPTCFPHSQLIAFTLAGGRRGREEKNASLVHFGFRLILRVELPLCTSTAHSLSSFSTPIQPQSQPDTVTVTYILHLTNNYHFFHLLHFSPYPLHLALLYLPFTCPVIIIIARILCPLCTLIVCSVSQR